MTVDELREKVALSIALSGPPSDCNEAVFPACYKHSDCICRKQADAAIRVVLEQALMAPVVSPDSGRHPEYKTGHTNGIQQKCDAIAFLVPQDKQEDAA